MRRRAGALYIKDGKLYLICERVQGFFYTPGGGLEDGETFEQALERELREEMNAKLLAAELYATYLDEDDNQEIHYFLVDIVLPDHLPGGTMHCWYGKDDHETNAIQVSKRVYHTIFPRLIADKLL